jgi:competence protein ComEA
MESRFDLVKLFDQYRIPALMAIFGLFLLGVGVLSVVFVSFNQAEPEVEILKADEVDTDEDIELIVDVAGAVENPGVYKLEKGARVNDALVAAGGLSAKADRVWVARYINLAQELNDGIKIYIPISGEEQKITLGSTAVPEGEVIGLKTAGKININVASEKELDGLWGIGEKRAAAIIENRPYATIDELLVKKVIPQNVFERIKDQISVF